MNARRLLIATTLVALGLTACGTSGLGESCSSIGKSEGCDDGLICDTSAGSKVCLKICTADAECATTEACTAVTGLTTKACHAK